VKVVAQAGETQQVDGHVAREKMHAFLQLGWAMLVRAAAERIDSAQEGPADATIDAVRDADLGRVEREFPGNPRHAPPSLRVGLELKLTLRRTKNAAGLSAPAGDTNT
jgi:hypothetical protein